MLVHSPVLYPSSFEIINGNAAHSIAIPRGMILLIPPNLHACSPSKYKVANVPISIMQGITLVEMMLRFKGRGFAVNLQTYFTEIRFKVGLCSLFLQFKEMEVSGALASGGAVRQSRAWCHLQRVASSAEVYVASIRQ